MNHHPIPSDSLACHDSSSENLWAARAISEHLNASAFCPEFATFTSKILGRCPRYVLASQTIRSTVLQKSSSQMRLQDGILMPWICLNTNNFVNILTFDIDHTRAREYLANIPSEIRPTLIEDPVSGRAHAFLLLRSPVYIGPKARQKPKKLLWLAHQLMAAALDATPLPYKSLIKSPWGLAKNLIGNLVPREPSQNTRAALPDTSGPGGLKLLWRTEPGTGLSELCDVVSLLMPVWQDKIQKPAKIWLRYTEREPSSLGRNCSLFDQVRWWCYAGLVKDLREISAYAHQINRTSPAPLPNSEVEATSRSICKFMNARYCPTHSIKGFSMSFSAENLDTRQKRRESAQRTSTIKKQKSYDRIEKALKAWPRRMPLTQPALTLQTGLCERTIGRYWHVDWPTGLSVILSGSEGSLARSAHPLRQLRTLKELADAFEKDCLWLTYYENHIAAQTKPGAEPCWPETPNDWLNTEVAWGYRHAEEATEDALHREDRRRKNIEREQRRMRIVDAGKRNTISVRLEETDRVKHRFDELKRRAAKGNWASDIMEKLRLGQNSSQKFIRKAYEKGQALQRSENGACDRLDTEPDHGSHSDVGDRLSANMTDGTETPGGPIIVRPGNFDWKTEGT